MTKNRLTPFTQNDYLIEKREVVYQGIFRVATYHLRFRLFNGDMSETVIREVFERKSVVALLPYDPTNDTVILIEQFRPGALANPQSPWLMEIIAGTFDANEKPKEAAHRETLEESGCEILDLLPICEYFVSPGGSNEYLFLFCGHVHTNNAGGIFGVQAEHEDIRNIILPIDEALIMLQKGQIKTPPAIIGLQWLQLNKEWLKQLWLKN